MLKIDYWCDLFDNQLPQLFTLFKVDNEELFYICSGTKFVGAIYKIDGEWQQIGGVELPQNFIQAIGKCIEVETTSFNSSKDQMYNSVNQ